MVKKSTESNYLVVLIQYQSVTDRQTDRHFCCSNVCIACYSTALVKKYTMFYPKNYLARSVSCAGRRQKIVYKFQ